MLKRKRWLAVHRWLALVLGAHWLLLATTGTVLIFHREIETAWIDASPARGGLADVDAALDAVARHQLGQARFVVIGDRPLRTLRVFAGEEIHTVDAASGRVLSSSGIEGGASPSGVLRFVYSLHHQLAAGSTGEWLVGASGLFLLFTVIAGLKLGWPAKGAWRRTLKPRLAGKNWQKHYVVHRSVGLLTAVALVSATLSGMGMIWGDALRGLVVPAVSGNASKMIGPGEPPSRPVRANQAISIAISQLPGSSFVRVDLPTEQRPSYLVRLREAGEFRPVFGTSIVEVGARGGAVVSVAPASAAPAGERVLAAMFSLHNGEWLGASGRLLVLLQGAALAYLAISGLIVWTARRSRG